jgi:putative membrane protein
MFRRGTKSVESNSRLSASPLIAAQTKAKPAATDRIKGRGCERLPFDRAYAQNELAFHILITGALEAKLIPSTQNGPVKNLLQNELALFKQHQDDATQLKSQFK